MNFIKLRNFCCVGSLLLLLGLYIFKEEEDLACNGCNLIMITMSNLRYQNLGINGYPRDTSRNIDLFFRNGLHMERVYTPASLTFSSGMSLFYSLYPYRHQFFK